MNPGYRRQALQLLHRENQRTLDHSMDHETMLARVDVRGLPTVLIHEMERGGRNDPCLILKRRPQRQERSFYRAGCGAPCTVGAGAHGGDEPGAIAVHAVVFLARTISLATRRADALLVIGPLLCSGPVRQHMSLRGPQRGSVPRITHARRFGRRCYFGWRVKVAVQLRAARLST